MKNIAAVALLVLVAGISAQAQTLDFEDLVAGTTYTSGDSFVTHGVTVTVTPTTGPYYVYVQTAGNAGGSGNELFLGYSGMELSFPSARTSVTMKIGSYSDGGGFFINGNHSDSLAFTQLSDLDGQSLGGVDFALLSSQTTVGGEYGVLSLTGTISMLEVAGSEIALDDVIATPEPASLMTLLFLSTGACLRRRRF